jgi:hypothetical protein
MVMAALDEVRYKELARERYKMICEITDVRCAVTKMAGGL